MLAAIVVYSTGLVIGLNAWRWLPPEWSQKNYGKAMKRDPLAAQSLCQLIATEYRQAGVEVTLANSTAAKVLSRAFDVNMYSVPAFSEYIESLEAAREAAKII